MRENVFLKEFRHNVNGGAEKGPILKRSFKIVSCSIFVLFKISLKRQKPKKRKEKLFGKTSSNDIEKDFSISFSVNTFYVSFLPFIQIEKLRISNKKLLCDVVELNCF